jgi:nonsense-mediated mRNA decay protein 3
MDEDGMGDDGIFHTRTHLGAILQPGDTVLGYHLTNANFNNSEFESLNQDRIPDVILVKKTYPNRRRKSRPRNWKLRSIAKEAEDATEGSNVVGRGALGRRGGVDQKNVERDYELFLRDLEEDKEMRAAINLYKSDKTAGPSGGDVDLSGHTAGSGMKGGKKRSGKKAQAQAAMDVEQDVQPTTSAPVARAQGGFRSTGDDMDEDGMDEDGDVNSEDDDADGEEEEDFPEIELDELLEHFEEMDVQDELEGGSEVQ